MYEYKVLAERDKRFGGTYGARLVEFDTGRELFVGCLNKRTHSDARRWIRATGCGTVLGWMKH